MARRSANTQPEEQPEHEDNNDNGADLGDTGGFSMLANPDEAFMERIRDAAEQLEGINERRSQLSADRTAVLEGLAADHGVNKHAMLAAIRYCDLKDKAKENWDLTYQVTRKALGAPVQMDLFEAQLERGVKQHVAAKTRAKPQSPESLFVN